MFLTKREMFMRRMKKAGEIIVAGLVTFAITLGLMAMLLFL